MEIYNLHKAKKSKEIIKNVYAPKNPFRMLVCGPSGSGKTNMVASIILNNLVYDRIYLYSKHIDDENDVYEDMFKVFSKIEKRIRRKTKDPEYQMAWYGNSIDDIPEVTEMDENFKNLILIDDFMNEKNQEKIHEYFTSGRHKNCSVIYLTQRYHNVHKVIRSNCNYFCFFEMSSRGDVQLIAKEHATDLDYDDFVEIFKEATNEKYSFLVIDRKTDEKCLKYRKRWDNLLFEC